jgi:hypothetical protein
MTPELTALACVALVVAAAWDIARRRYQHPYAKQVVEQLNRNTTQANEIGRLLNEHEKNQDALMLDWRAKIDEIDRKIADIHAEVRRETAGTLAAAAEGISRSKWR